MLPEMISKEIFNLRFKIGDMAIEFITDEFCKYGLHINRIIDNDLAVTFYAKGRGCTIEMRIDRMAKLFEISATNNGWTIMPTSGNWKHVEQYLTKLTKSISYPVKKSV